MAEKRDPWSKFREEDKEILSRKSTQEPLKRNSFSSSSSLPEETKDLEALLAKAEPLIEQIQNLYQLYLNGMERLPPLTHRKQLDDLILKMNTLAKTSASQKFRAQQFQSKYLTYKDKWERLHKDLESGKVQIKRKSHA